MNITWYVWIFQWRMEILFAVMFFHGYFCFVVAQTCSSQIGATWGGFYDPHSHVTGYSVSIGKCRGCGDILEKSNIGLTTSMSTLQIFVTYTSMTQFTLITERCNTEVFWPLKEARPRLHRKKDSPGWRKRGRPRHERYLKNKYEIHDRTAWRRIVSAAATPQPCGSG